MAEQHVPGGRLLWPGSGPGEQALQAQGDHVRLGLCFLTGSILQATAPEVVTLVIGHMLLGVGIGAANQACLLPGPATL